MKSGVEMFARLRAELGQHPAVLSVLFGFVLVGVEKMVEVDFACPCSGTRKWNILFVVPFVIPGFIASVLMLLIYGHRECKEWVVCLYPLTLWFALILFDGQYLVCAMTDWPGTFVDDKTTYLKWCKPTNTTKSSSEELMNRSHTFHIWSQWMGNGIFSFLMLILIGYIIWRIKQKENKNTEKTEEEAPDSASIPLNQSAKAQE